MIFKLKKTSSIVFLINVIFLPLIYFAHPLLSQGLDEKRNLDKQVKKFLESHKHKWVDWNVSETDGRFLYDVVIKNNYTKALEIGTSTGHSAIWIAWALSKTGGKLITIEIDEDRHRTAIDNFEKAGLSSYIDARLANAHHLVEELRGPFDLVFSDADKNWYKNYFMALAPKLEVGGCFSAHNVLWGHNKGISEFLDYVKSLPNFRTKIVQGNGEGISVSIKIAEK